MTLDLPLDSAHLIKAMKAREVRRKARRAAWAYFWLCVSRALTWTPKALQ